IAITLTDRYNAEVVLSSPDPLYLHMRLCLVSDMCTATRRNTNTHLYTHTQKHSLDTRSHTWKTQTHTGHSLHPMSHQGLPLSLAGRGWVIYGCRRRVKFVTVR